MYSNFEKLIRKKDMYAGSDLITFPHSQYLWKSWKELKHGYKRIVISLNNTILYKTFSLKKKTQQIPIFLQKLVYASEYADI